MKVAKEKQSQLSNYLDRYNEQIESSLKRFLPVASSQINSRYNEAINYAIFSGGKRLRPVLTLLGAELVGGMPENVLHLATATEFIHTSSLIFDDLPCMDNSLKRRGKDSLHLVYGEGLAILVAIGLLNASYELAFADRNSSIESALNIQAEIVESIGANGMVGGQAIDLAMPENSNFKSIATEQSETQKNLKTSALIKLSLRMGAIASKATETELDDLSDFAVLMGNAYQLRDDLVDQAEDKQLEKNETVCRKRLEIFVREAKSVIISRFEQNMAQTCLLEFMDYIAKVE